MNRIKILLFVCLVLSLLPIGETQHKSTIYNPMIETHPPIFPDQIYQEVERPMGFMIVAYYAGRDSNNIKEFAVELVKHQDHTLEEILNALDYYLMTSNYWADDVIFEPLLPNIDWIIPARDTI